MMVVFPSSEDFVRGFDVFVAILRRLLIVLAVACSAAVLSTNAFAADAWDRLRTTVFTNLGREAGLPHPVAMALAQDGEGFLWVGTQGGLSRYDGYRFRTFFHRDDDPYSPPGNVISDLATDRSGRLWVGTVTGGVARYDPATDRFDAVPPAAGAAGRGSVLRLAGDGGDGIWVATNTGLEHIDAAKGVVARYLHRADDAGSLPGDRIRTVLRSRDDTLWVATYQGLVRKSGDSFLPVPLLDGQGRAIDDVVTGLVEDSSGRIWLATARSGLGRIDPPAKPGGPGAAAHLIPSIGSGVSFALTEGRPGEIWVGQVAGGILVIDAATGRMRTIRHDPALRDSLGDDSVRALFKDRSGILWAGTNVGVSRTNLAADAVESVLPSITGTGGLRDKDVLSVQAMADGHVWLGTKTAGLAVVDPRQGTISSLPKAPDLATGAVLASATTADGITWIAGNTGRTLFRRDEATGAVTEEPFPQSDTGQILSMIGHAGALWFAAGPLIRRDQASGAYKIYRHSEDPQSLIDDSCNVMLPAGPGGLWIGTRRGLDYLDLATGTFRHAAHDPADPASLPDNLVTTLLVDRQGRLWVGTLGGGIGILETPIESDHPRFRRLTTADGLPSLNVATLLEGRDGRIWGSTADGIVCRPWPKFLRSW